LLFYSVFCHKEILGVGYMLICRNAKGVHSERNVGNPWSSRWWAAIRLSRHSEPSRHGLRGEVHGLDSVGQHGQRSAGLTIVANVAIATGPALLGTPRSSVINLIYYIHSKKSAFC